VRYAEKPCRHTFNDGDPRCSDCNKPYSDVYPRCADCGARESDGLVQFLRIISFNGRTYLCGYCASERWRATREEQ
jgi:hypothetical protein